MNDQYVLACVKNKHDQLLLYDKDNGQLMLQINNPINEQITSLQLHPRNPYIIIEIGVKGILYCYHKNSRKLE